MADSTIRNDVSNLEQVRGWFERPLWELGTATTINARRALSLVLAGYAEGDRLTYSHLVVALRTATRCLSVERTAMVLQEMGVYVDDRRSRLDANLQAKLDGLATGIAAETEQWIRSLVDGGPRRAPRSKQTALRYLHSVQPALLAWSQHYSNLREVTRDDVLTHLQPLTGNTRQATLVALRSLFSTA